MNQPIYIFDTTLRDGLQSSRKKVAIDDRVAIAGQLSKMGVNVIEAGFANSNDEDGKAIRRIAREVGARGGATICSLARLHPTDIKEGIDAIQGARSRRLHTFIGTSDIHMKYKLQMSPEEVLSGISEFVAIGANSGKVDENQFSFEDFSRTRTDFAIKAGVAAYKAGARIINMPDTVGYSLPFETEQKVRAVIKGMNDQGCYPVFAVHNHNDLGLATANTLSGVMAGARQVEVTMNGIGERAGNSALEEIVAIFSTREIKDGDDRLTFDLDRSMIGPLSSYVANAFGIYVPANKAIVGGNALAHGSGIHQDGVSKNMMTYEIIDGATYGVQESHFYLSPHSGAAGILDRAKKIGLDMTAEGSKRISRVFSNSIDRIYADDADIVRAAYGDSEIPEYYKVLEFNPIVGFDNTYKMVVEMEVDGVRGQYVASGEGLIDAAANAIRGLIRKPEYTVEHYNVESQAKQTDAKGLAQMVVKDNGYEVSGLATNKDVLTASIHSFVDGANRMRYMEERLRQ